MSHETALIATIAAGLGLAFLLGFGAARVGLPPLVGYLLAGVMVGPFTPGFVADTGLAAQLAEIGVILLMFGVGLHFSVNDLLAVRKLVIPGALLRITMTTALGAIVAHGWGWSWSAGAVLGLALSVASTVVVLRVLEERGTLDTLDGRIAIGWLVVEDLVMVLVVVLLPALAPAAATGGSGGNPSMAAATPAGILLHVAVTLGEVLAFIALMYVVGRRAIPWLLTRVARQGSRELFTLAVLAVALGIAVGAAALFGVSFALGAFAAGVVISESDLSYQAGADALPLQDAFAVLFFVSIGMLFDPATLIREPLHVITVVLVVVAARSVVAFATVVGLRYPVRTALNAAVTLAQIGEFSFILAGLGVALGVLPPEGRSLIVAAAIASIAINPLLFRIVEPADRWLRRHPRWAALLERPAATHAIHPGTADTLASLEGHAVIVGYGRVGSAIGTALARHGAPYVVIEQDHTVVEALRRHGTLVIYGDASRPGILAHAALERARLLVVASPGPYQARQIVALARQMNPRVDTVVRTHTVAEEAYFHELGVGRVVMGEHELARGMAHYALRSLGLDDARGSAGPERGREHGPRSAREDDVAAPHL